MQSIKCEIVFLKLPEDLPIVIFEEVYLSESQLNITNALLRFNKSFAVGDIQIPWDDDSHAEQKVLIPRQEDILLTEKLTIHYKEQNDEEDDGKHRSKERTIREVLMGVKKWRKLHDKKSKDSEKMSFEDAAKTVGFSKKSLDDYYCQLRLAEKFDFDFIINLDEKVGVLRNFVKAHRKSSKRKSTKKKNEKISKELTILDKLQLSEEEPLPPPQPEKEQEQEMYQVKLTPREVSLKEEYENQFYRNLFLMDTEAIDPFVPFRPYDYRPFEPFSFNSV